MKIETKYNLGQELYIIDDSSITMGRVTKISIEHSVLFEKNNTPLIIYYIDGSRLQRYESEVAGSVEGLIRIHAKLAH